MTGTTERIGGSRARSADTASSLNFPGAAVSAERPPPVIVRNEAPVLRPAIDRVLADPDAVIPSAGSSILTKDLAANAVAGLPRPGALFHRIDIRPASRPCSRAPAPHGRGSARLPAAPSFPRNRPTALFSDSFTHR
jgi:hypothetical protein